MEEMTDDLHAIRTRPENRTSNTGRRIMRRLRSKGVRFGRITARRVSNNPCVVRFNTSQIAGGEAQESRDRFVSMSKRNQACLITYLNNLVLFNIEEEHGTVYGKKPPKEYENEDDKDDEKEHSDRNDKDGDKYHRKDARKSNHKDGDKYRHKHRG